MAAHAAHARQPRQRADGERRGDRRREAQARVANQPLNLFVVCQIIVTQSRRRQRVSGVGLRRAVSILLLKGQACLC